MQFIPLVNFEAYQRAAVNGSNKQFTDTSGTGHNIYSGANASNYVPFYISSGTYTATGVYYPFPYASSATEVPYDTTTILEQVGTTSVSFTYLPNGWNGNIRITGTEEATIRHFIFVKKINYTTSSSSDAVIFAIKLDTPIELNEANNYTADFTLTLTV